MRRGLILTLLIITVHSVIYFRLNTNQNITLNVGDSLISTLGLFKATLLQNQCVLSIATFNSQTNTYSNLGNYSSANTSTNCQSITIKQGAVTTDSNITYMYVGASYNLSTILTIDDWGVIRLIGTYQLPNYVDQVSEQYNYTVLKTNQTFLYPTSQMTFGFMSQSPIVNNLRGWQFKAMTGQLSISQYQTSGIGIKYTYGQFYINNSNLQDFNQQTFPSAIFPNITFPPRCLEPRLYLNFKPPYVFVADPYWPIFTLYEQGRYKVFQMSFNTIFQVSAWQNGRRLTFRSEQSVCPEYTFQFKGGCVTTCPYPYYHQLREQFGYCVLTCQEYTPKDDNSRICSCYTNYEQVTLNIQNVNSCPKDAVQYPYGCYCNSTNLYFDRYTSLSCVTTCPNNTLGINGLCMICPEKCLSCRQDQMYRSFFECIACQSGFTIANGQCIRTCSPGLGYSIIQGSCQPCSDPNCLNCSQNVGVCTKCNLLYVVSNGACMQTCSNTSQMVPYQDLSSTCLAMDQNCLQALSTYYKNMPMLKCITCKTYLYLHQNTCVNQCPAGYIANSNSYCYCSNSSTLTVGDKCLPIPACPIQMGWDPLSSSCLSCNFGCLTCYNSGCTSCNPGYFLYVSPQGIRCRRKSPLFPCDQQYGWIDQVCLLLNYSNPNLRLTGCYFTVANCKACHPGSSSICTVCNTGFYNFNNTCIQACPIGTIAYNGNVCIYPQINNCSLPYLQINSQAFIVNFQKVSQSDPYKFYTFKGLQGANDPAGYIPVYQMLTSRKSDGYFRDSQFYFPSWTCLKCNDGNGLSKDFSVCLPCPDPCLTCYLAQNNSCLKLKQVTPIIPIVPQTCQYYIDFESSKCVMNCSDANKIPMILNGTLFCYPASSASTTTIATIDSATYTTSSGSTFVFFVLDHELQTTSTVNLPITKETSAPRVSAGSNTASSNIENVALSNTGYLYLYDVNKANQLWILNATGQLQKIAGNNQVSLSNSVYGVSSGQGHTQFMKTWLAYIGYIMGIVLICLHVIFIGNDLLYKVDNTLILAQSIYFFSFVQLLVGRLLSQFYYGWLFSHFGFFPNFFVNTIPASYAQLDAPNSYKLATLDVNIVRNAGWAFSLLLVFIGIYGIIAFICWMLHSLMNKTDVWHPRIAINSLIAGIQFLSMSIFYWAVANLLYIGSSYLTDQGFYSTSKTVSILFIVIITIYTLIRWFFNPLGGLYMSKRILVATILAASYLNNKMLAPLVILQAVFCILRFTLERPQKNRMGYIIVLESLLHIGVYFLLFLSLDAGVNTIIISIAIFIMIVVLSYHLADVYLESQNQWELEEKQQESEGSQIVRAEANKRLSNVRVS